MTDNTVNTPAKKAPGLLRSSVLVGSMTMTSRVLGLLRDVVVAAFVGATANADAFFVAFKIPNFLRRLFAEGAFSQAFIPVLADYKADGSRVAVKALIDRVSGVLGGSLLLITAISMLAAPMITMIFAPGFVSQPEKFELTAAMIRITFPYLLLISMTGFCGAILNSYGRFAVPAFTPVFLNLSLIFAALVAAPWFEVPVFALAWGVLFRRSHPVIVSVLYRLELVPRPRWDTKDAGVRRILKLMVPALFGVSVGQINLLLDTVLASFLPTGSVSWLYYSDRLAELPLGIFGIAIATVILPNLSAHRAAARESHFSGTLDWAVRWVLLIGVPSALALVLLAQPILITLFQYGKLTSNDVSMSALSLQAYSLGLVAFMLVKVLAPGFYARKDTATPVKIGIIAMVANMFMNVLLAVPLMYLWNVGHLGLALATSLAAILNAGLLLRGLLRNGIYQFQPGWVSYLWRLLFACACMVAAILWLVPEHGTWLGWHWQRRVGELLLLCTVGVIVYFAALGLLGTRMSHLRAPATF
ncbi:MAG: murein biosynthesis integral membrane protein MurJ [Haliea sp.]|nr:murein biosynthesis integral membrane protein MurJ [Haliea sp.]